MKSAIKHCGKRVLMAGAILFFVLFQLAFSPLLSVAQQADDEETLNDSIASIKKDLKKELKDKSALEQDLQGIQQSVYSTQREINKTATLIEQTAETIDRKEKEIKSLSQKVDLQREVLKSIMQEFYYVKKDPLLNVVLREGDFSDVLGNADHMLELQEKVRTVSQEILETKDAIASDMDKLAEVKNEHEQLLEIKEAQKKTLVSDKLEVQGDLAEKEATIGELQGKLAEMQSDLNALTGKSYNAKDIREAVEFASSQTGVPKGVLYGFLKMETNLGANTGQCTYKEVEKVAVARYKKYGSKYKNSIALLYERQELFYELMDDLGYSKNKKVSCSPSGYIGQGGAMGIPQFMSDVWKGYSARITAKTGHKNPDPWDLTDGVMAMAIKLQGAGATSDSASAIRKASINYLGTFYANYYNGIVYWSKNYKRLFSD